MRTLTYVTGTSCAGKTSVAQALRDQLADDYRATHLTAVGGWCAPSTDYMPAPPTERTPFHVVDVDEDGTPEGGGGHWLAYRSLDLLARHGAGEYPTDHLVLCGIAMPFEVLDSREARDTDLDLRFLLLDVTDELLEARLLERFPKPKKERKLREHYVRSNGLLARRLRHQVQAVRRGLVLSADSNVAMRARFALEDW